MLSISFAQQINEVCKVETKNAPRKCFSRIPSCCFSVGDSGRTHKVVYISNSRISHGNPGATIIRDEREEGRIVDLSAGGKVNRPNVLLLRLVTPKINVDTFGTSKKKERGVLISAVRFS